MSWLLKKGSEGSKGRNGAVGDNGIPLSPTIVGKPTVPEVICKFMVYEYYWKKVNEVINKE